MPGTRSKAGTEKPTATKASAEEKPAKREALQSVDVPSRTLILPSRRSDASRFLTLPNPSSGAPGRYFFDPEAGLYEFTAVAPTQFDPKSILFTTNHGDEGVDKQNFKSHVLKKAELLIATPIDVLFFMLPIIAPAENTSTSNMFQPLDDILDSQDELSPHLRHIVYNATFRPILERRMQAACDVMDAADETLYRFNESKLLNELIAKANRMIAQGLPTSLEEHFIKKTLEPPLMSVKREDIVTTVSTTVDKEDGQEVEVEETQSISATTVNTISGQPSGVSTPATQPSTVDVISSSESVARLLRLRIALSFMKQSYLPNHLSSKMEDALKQLEKSPIDFTPLDNRLKELADLRAEAIAARAIGDYTRKRGFEEEDDNERETKRKKEEEKKLKATESRGVRDLKKVNTSGMKKMSDFFKKKS